MHRGPDDEGIFVKAGVGLGMRRLSIIDLAGGHQPVFNEDKTVWIVFNGEIYNFPRTAARVGKPRPSLFYPHRHRGDRSPLRRIWGGVRAQAARHVRFRALRRAPRPSAAGARPLGQEAAALCPDRWNCCCFASEIKAILAVAPDLARVNRQALLQYMYFGYIPDPATAFRADSEAASWTSAGIRERGGTHSPVLGSAAVRHA